MRLLHMANYKIPYRQIIEGSSMLTCLLLNSPLHNSLSQIRCYESTCQNCISGNICLMPAFLHRRPIAVSLNLDRRKTTDVYHNVHSGCQVCLLKYRQHQSFAKSSRKQKYDLVKEIMAFAEKI